MGAKYTKGQKVRIISLRDEHLKAKHPHIEEYVSQTGVIVESHWFGVSKPHRPDEVCSHIIDHHIYDFTTFVLIETTRLLGQFRNTLWSP